MNSATPDRSAPTELTHASQVLAAFFDGVAFVEEADGTIQPLPAPTEISQPPRSRLLDGEDNWESAQLEDQRLISLNQLRQWYAIARDLKRQNRLRRIAELGSLFKQTFGEANPNVAYPFNEWSATDVNTWLADLATWKQHNSKRYY